MVLAVFLKLVLLAYDISVVEGQRKVKRNLDRFNGTITAINKEHLMRAARVTFLGLGTLAIGCANKPVNHIDANTQPK